MNDNRELLLLEADRLMLKPTDPDKAAAIYLDLLKDDSENVDLLIKAADAIYQSDDWGEYDANKEPGYEKIALMFELLERAVKLRPNDPDTHFHLGSYSDSYGAPDATYIGKAAAEFRRSLELNPNHVMSNVRLAILWNRRVPEIDLSLDQAIEHIKTAIASDPDDPGWWSNLGQMLYFDKKDYTAALEAYTKALSKTQEDMVDKINGYKKIIKRVKFAIRKESKSAPKAQ